MLSVSPIMVRPSTGRDRLAIRSRFSFAMLSVSPTMIFSSGAILTEAGSRPAVAIPSLSVRYCFLPLSSVGYLANTSSAQREAKRRPRPLWPACRITGWPCFERGTGSGPRDLK